MKKKLLAGLATGLFMFGMVGTAQAQAELTTVNCLNKGDFDCDGDVDATDLEQFAQLYGKSHLLEAYYSAQVPQTGQTAIYATGDDGDLQAGVVSPEPRFIDNGDGTVTDNLTGLIWLMSANCFGTKDWSIAITDSSTLNDGECGLTDGSVEGEWRLPNAKELQSLIDFSITSPALPSGQPFTGVQSYNYWSSNTNPNNASLAWVVHLGLGYVYDDSKTSIGYVWPVRGGQIE